MLPRHCEASLAGRPCPLSQASLNESGREAAVRLCIREWPVLGELIGPCLLDLARTSPATDESDLAATSILLPDVRPETVSRR